MDEVNVPEDTFMSNISKNTIYYQNLAQVNSYKFGEFDITKELSDKKNFSMTITSKRRTGKSVLLKDLCHKMKNWYSQVFLFSMTSDLQPELYDFIPNKNIFNSFNEAKIEEIWNRQEKLITSMKTLEVSDAEMPHILLIFDDVISDPRVKKSEIFNRIAVAGRHIKLACITLSQTFTGLPPVVRVNVDCAIAFYLDSADNRESFAKQYLSTKSVRQGVLIFEKITKEEYNAIVCLNFRTSQNPEDTVKTYKAKLKVPKFVMGKNGMKHIYLREQFVEEEMNKKVELKINKDSGKTISLKKTIKNL